MSEIACIELETGMTKNSLLPKSAQGASIPYHKLLDLIIEHSLNVRGKF